MVILFFAVYCSNGGRLSEKPFDHSLLDDINPVRRKLNIEACTTATVTVVSLDDFAWAGVIAEFDGFSNTHVHIYLSNKDAAKIDAGDVITVKGRIKYMSVDNDIQFQHIITIGDAIATPPYSFCAKLVGISNSDKKSYERKY